jgi:general stress protein YciG
MESIEQVAAAGGQPSNTAPGQSTDQGFNVDENLKTGFAVMDPEKQREIARKGGQARGKQLHEQAMRSK